MSKKNNGGMVYSTNPDFSVENESSENASIPISDQVLHLHRETKGRAGKAVAIVKGFVGPKDELESLGKKLKGHCGTGGSIKDGEIIIQGDQRSKVKEYLDKMGYRTKNVGG
ncbi:MAG TPA: translation initiation factor [Flavobacteriales bacterium]|nr:translation initiation factor [Flavobacteriales bacterium]MDB9701288.1 translation initiation factor [Salibacteraceae bacterium]HAW18839.1 translation initiation factor [Flavobacteriales bacterium]